MPDNTTQEKLDEVKAQWGKTRKWRHDRLESIKADPAAAACVFLVGVALAEISPYAVRAIGWVLK